MRRGLVIALLATALAATVAAPADADFGFEPGSVHVTSLEAGGQPETQAGAHPDTLNVEFAFTRTPEGELEANARDLTVDLPAGYIGDPTATPQCSRAQIVLAGCPPETQVGVATIEFAPSGEEAPVAVYNVVPEQGVTAEFAMFIFLFPVRLTASVRSEGDFGTRVTIRDMLQEFPLDGAQITLWGVPADHQTGTSIPRSALLTLPTRCGVPLSTDLSVRTWEQPNASLTASDSSGPLTGCESLDFSPTATVVPDARTAATPTGVHVDIDLPQHLGASELATAHPSRATVALPAGMELTPSVAQEPAACGDAQAGLDSGAAPACPAAARIGTAEIDTPLLADPLRGGVYVATPAAGGGVRLFVTAQGSDYALKLVGALRRDPDSGRLVATVDDLPQMPLSHIALDFQGGPRAPFVTPRACGPQTASVVLASWAGRISAPATSTVAFGDAGGASCQASPPSAPTAAAGASSRPAGADSAPSARLELAGRVSPLGGTAHKPGVRVSLRRGGGASLRSLAIALPRMLRLDRGAATAVCARDEARKDRCPAAARVGSASLRTPLLPGPMSAPVYLVAAGRRGGLPSLWASLAGDRTRVVFEGALGVRRDGQVTSTFANLPDLPLTAFELRLRGGAHGLLTTDARRCRLPLAQRTSARVAVRSQGGLSASQPLATGPWGRCVQRR